MPSCSYLPSNKDTILYSQLLCLRRLCPEDEDFRNRANEIVDSFWLRRYPDRILSWDFPRSLFINCADAFTSNPREQKRRPILSLTYHPHNIAVEYIICCHLPILHSEPPALALSSPKHPCCHLNRIVNLRNILVHKRVQTALPPPPFHCPS